MDTRYQKEKIDTSKVQNLFKEIVRLQKELIDGYVKIEGLPPYPLNIDTKESQLLIKDFIARIVEELAEAYEYLEKAGSEQLFKEEMADALHFFVETLIYVDHPMLKAEGDILKEYTKYTSFSWLSLSNLYWDITYKLNLARNTLRNKSWKQTEVRANQELFYKLLDKAFLALLSGMITKLGFSSPEEIFVEYYKKNKVNRWRQETKY